MTTPDLVRHKHTRGAIKLVEESKTVKEVRLELYGYLKKEGGTTYGKNGEGHRFHGARDGRPTIKRKDLLSTICERSRDTEEWTHGGRKTERGH